MGPTLLLLLSNYLEIYMLVFLLDNQKPRDAINSKIHIMLCPFGKPELVQKL